MKNDNQYYLINKIHGTLFRRVLFSFILIPLFNFLSNKSIAQDFANIKGIVSSEKGELLSGVTIQVNRQITVGQTNKDGYFQISKIPLNAELTFSRVGFKSYSIKLDLDPFNDNDLNITLSPQIQSLDEVYITESFSLYNFNKIDFIKYSFFPQPSGSFENFIKTLPGVSGNNELSSEYNVRGGNFDENLVYINDVEIYKPLLSRSGQQEGLGFINPSLSSNIYFSAGGFEARYGDRMSSMLDVKYSKPDSLTLETQIGSILNSASLKLPYKNGFILSGFRLKNNQSLLKRQNIDGNYFSKFSDFQFFLKQHINPELNFSLFYLNNQGDFDLEPQKQITEFGTSDEVLKLKVDYSGYENSNYNANIAAMIFSFNPTNSLNIKWISSYSGIDENENANLLAWYSFIDREGGGLSTKNKSTLLGSGTNHTFYKNSLRTYIFNTEIKLHKQFRKSFLEIGARLQTDEIKDNLDEFNATDTSSFSFPDKGKWTYWGLINQTNQIDFVRLNSYIQNTFNLNTNLTLVTGLRLNYNNFSNEILISPRFSIIYHGGENNKLQLKFSAGAYHQSPFYREIKNYDGSINLDAKAQKSVQFNAGMNYIFSGLGTTLKFGSEMYYKILTRITPYKIEDLKIKYLSDQKSNGYALGADFFLSGKFAKDLESTLRLSLLKTEENIKDDLYFSNDPLGNSVANYPGYLRRPTDQLLNIGLMFQDRLIQNPTYRVHLNLMYSSSLPTGPYGPQRHTDRFNIPAYKRVDIGFSKDFADVESKKNIVFIKKNLQQLSLHAELLNLFNFKNTTSYRWISDREGRQYAVPNYLSSRMLNLRLIAILKSR